MANVLKLQKLKERCDGEAYDAIKRFNTDAGYQEALAKLKQRFGSDAQAIAALRKQLYVPVKDKTDLLAVRKSFDDFECCLSKLDEYNQDIDSIEFKLALLRKLPDIIISKLSDFEISLKREATVAEYCEHADLQISAHQKNFGNKFQQGFQKSNKKVEISKAVANTTRDPKVKRHQDPNLGDRKPQQHQQARVKYPPKCSFCEGQHRNDNCPVVTTVEEAKLIASDKRLCFTCFRSNHRTPDCRKEIECTHCHKPHHTLYCHSLRPDLRHNSRKDSKGSSPVVAAYKAVSSESDTEVLLFTREVLVSHPGNPSLAQKVLVFVDNGAQIPLIDYTLSASLKLPCANVSTTCQGADGNQFVASGKYKLNIHLEDGTTLPVYPYGAANLVQRISVPKVPVEKYLRATKGKFPLPIKLGLPLLLLSMREYALLFIDEDSKKLDNGFVLWQSKLGPFISGEGKVQRECIRSQSPLFRKS
uniref:Peptidase aspartic putative domain-containing protein n=1 Tax=Panagrolaimus superbus TaxID=310955 RepID=A0A914Z2V7_9BILA